MGQSDEFRSREPDGPAKVQSAEDEDLGNPSINLRGDKRRNDTHQSTTDPQNVLYWRVNDKEAKLCFGGHIIMENRNGLCAGFTIYDPVAEPELVVALQQVSVHQKLHEGIRVKTVGADKGDHLKTFVAVCRDWMDARRLTRVTVSASGSEGGWRKFSAG